MRGPFFVVCRFERCIPLRGGRLYLLEKAINGICQVAVFIGHNPSSIMGVQFNAHIAVLIVETGVMGMVLCQKSHTRHERECFLKVLESKFPDQAVVLLEPHIERFML